jgi:hypothetical protein
MAIELESTIMQKIGLGQHYSWSNGSGSCRYIRDEALKLLPGAAAENGLTIHPAWLAHCRKASRVDQVGGDCYRLTNVWIACSYAIEDAIHRSEGGEGFTPQEDWYFFSDAERQRWQMMTADREAMMRHRFRQEAGGETIMFKEINFSPFATNVIDCIGRNDLITQDGRLVSILRNMTEFVIIIDGEIHRTKDNVTASKILNDCPVGHER